MDTNCSEKIFPLCDIYGCVELGCYLKSKESPFSLAAFEQLATASSELSETHFINTKNVSDAVGELHLKLASLCVEYCSETRKALDIDNL